MLAPTFGVGTSEGSTSYVAGVALIDQCLAGTIRYRKLVEMYVRQAVMLYVPFQKLVGFYKWLKAVHLLYQGSGQESVLAYIGAQIEKRNLGREKGPKSLD
jgi:hypothetical protein